MILGSRRSVFDGKPTTVYVPRDYKHEVTATGSMIQIIFHLR
ncbi:MAG: 5-deoxy-glucuronate isomerase [Eubacterium sp.]|nr:5-deoxy-glucuronate isomerase [Eubacterium sp.]